MQKGKIVGVCISEKRGTAKQNVGKGYMKKNYGLENDGHGGTERQVSLLMAESVKECVQKHGLKAKPGDFAENILTEGIDLKLVKVGNVLRVGEAELRVTQIGKEVHEGHYSFHGLALLPTEGFFCKVLKDGEVKVGDEVSLKIAPGEGEGMHGAY